MDYNTFISDPDKVVFAMRRILIERARRKRTTRHGGYLQRVDLEALEIASPLPDDDLLALQDALDRLAVLDAPAAELIKLRFFAGLTQAQAAEALGMSKSTADRNWLFARDWLYREIHPQVQAKAVSAGKD